MLDYNIKLHPFAPINLLEPDLGYLNEIRDWLDDTGIEYRMSSPVIDPLTFQPTVTLSLPTEQEYVLFRIRWGYLIPKF